MLADAGDGPVEYVAVLVPPIVKVDGATPFAVVPPSLFTVITTVTVWPGVTVAGVATMDDVSAAVASIVTSFETLDVDEIELPEVAPVPLALPVKLTVPADPAVYVHVNVALPPAAMLADAGDDPVAVPVLVPPNVRDDGATLSTCSPPVLLTVITTVMVWPGVTVAGVADIEDVRTPKGVEIVTLFEVAVVVYS
jgi:hypothetical protein